jgi:hypothetical protein
LQRTEEMPQSVRAVTDEFGNALQWLHFWVEQQDYSGHEPYDVLNSRRLARIWNRSRIASICLIQLGRRFGGARLRRWLEVPASKNPKALGLFLAGYCDLGRCGGKFSDRAKYLSSELKRLSAPGEAELSWGYDWNFVSLRGSVMRAFAANSIATVFCANALLDAAEVFGDCEYAEMAESAARFCISRLSRSWDTPEEVCFSYTPEDRTLIYNNSLLVGALLARVGARTGNREYIGLARRAMQYVCLRQRNDGAWSYGAGNRQGWVDGFHTGYNLCALSAYRRFTTDHSFDEAIARGYRFYVTRCFSADGIPKYFEDGLYPIDIHACAQAVITFCEFADGDPEALRRACDLALWTIRNMRSAKGYFYYQRHRMWTNRTPYMRWAQAWMFRALTKVLAILKEKRNDTLD